MDSNSAFEFKSNLQVIFSRGHFPFEVFKLYFYPCLRYLHNGRNSVIAIFFFNSELQFLYGALSEAFAQYQNQYQNLNIFGVSTS